MMETEMKFWIWSREHRAWWAPAERGYTEDVRRAGIYPLNRAWTICKRANEGQRFEEFMVPVDEEKQAEGE
jgi:hypothetical protein